MSKNSVSFSPFFEKFLVILHTYYAIIVLGSGKKFYQRCCGKRRGFFVLTGNPTHEDRKNIKLVLIKKIWDKAVLFSSVFC